MVQRRKIGKAISNLKRQNHKSALFTISYGMKGSPCMQILSGPAFNGHSTTCCKLIWGY